MCTEKKKKKKRKKKKEKNQKVPLQISKYTEKPAN